jgi:DNA-binding transcriptional regulator LsrR (DeoR family)
MSLKKAPHGGIMRRHPWEAIGMSRASWYRHGKPTTKPQQMTQTQIAAMMGVSLRTVQRVIRQRKQEREAERIAFILKWRADRITELNRQGLDDVENTVNREMKEKFGLR